LQKMRAGDAGQTNSSTAQKAAAGEGGRSVHGARTPPGGHIHHLSA
jgi:hypothetical protein